MESENTTADGQDENLVQNGTDLGRINEPVLPFIDKYKGFAKAGAEDVIQQCRVIVEAEEELNKRNFCLFCEQIKLDPKSSTFRKMRVIGERADRLLAVVDRMPNSWTTLYALARLEADVFDRLVQSDILHPSTTAADVQEELSEPKPEQPEAAHAFFRVDLANLLDGAKLEFLTEVKEAADRHGVTLELSKALKTLTSKAASLADFLEAA